MANHVPLVMDVSWTVQDVLALAILIVQDALDALVLAQEDAQTTVQDVVGVQVVEEVAQEVAQVDVQVLVQDVLVLVPEDVQVVA